MTIGKDGFKTEIKTFDEDSLAQAVALIADNQPVALPTETVYGLAANAQSSMAVAEIFRAKNRPSFNPLIVHVPNIAAAALIGDFSPLAKNLVTRFWPGPLTMVLPLTTNGKKAVAPAVSAGLDTIALRCPAHPVMRAVLERSGLPLAAPSANLSGGISPTQANHVAGSLGGRIPLILDGGRCKQGLESTIIAVSNNGWHLLRAGPISVQDICEAADQPEAKGDFNRGTISAPGQLESHYAPTKKLRLNAEHGRDNEWLIALGDMDGDDNLSPTCDMAEVAANLYAALHRADASEKTAIAVVPIPESGIGEAINDRLRRAAA